MVYRPPKHKPGAPNLATSRPGPNRPDAGAFGSQTDIAHDPKAKLPGDDRNLVTVDESYAGGDMEDRLWLFWRRQGKNVVRLVILVGVGVIAWQGWNLYQAHVLKGLQDEFQVQSDKGAAGLVEFAQAHPDTTLGKLAVLEAADTYYQDGKFKDAADNYSKALTIWGTDEKGQRAHLGWALSLLQTGDLSGAEKQLTDLAEQTGALENYRAEAAFYAAVVYTQAGDQASANKWLGEVAQYKSMPPFTGQATTLQEMIPMLANLKLIPGNGTPASAPLSTAETPPVVSVPVAGKPAATATPAATSAAPASTGNAPGGALDLPKLNN